MVCEGSKTEPNYFKEIRRYFKIPTAHWAILPSEYGTGPEKVVEFAEYKARKERTWDEVYCIFDRDDHVYYRTAVEKARALDCRLRTSAPVKNAVRFTAIPSVPCFELWFLLHFEPVTREEHRDEIVRRLKVKVPGYDKGLSDMYQRMKSNLSIAIARAQEEREQKTRTGNDNPSTDVDFLVKRLMEIGPSRS
jgi:hypothetical protein